MTHHRSRSRAARHAEGGSPEDELIACIGKKWRLRVLTCLAGQPLRFNAIQRHLHGLSAHILTKTLREMERDGLVLRGFMPTRPPGVEYRLSPIGERLLVSLSPLFDWLSANGETIARSRVAFDSADRGVDG